MKKILCFGDSNTFGYIPNDGGQYADGVRWTSRLANLLGKNYQIIEAGCSNRTCFSDNDEGDIKTGYKAIEKYLPNKYDCILVAVGVNDIQLFYKPTLEEFEQGCEKFIKQIKSKKKKKIVIVAPPIVKDCVKQGTSAFQFDDESIEKSKYLPDICKRIAERNDCYFIDFNDRVQVSNLDGLHYMPEAHAQIADILSKYLRDVV